MRDDSLVIQEGLPDRDKLSEALDVVTSDNAQRLAAEKDSEKPTFISPAASEPLAQAVNDIPAVFFVNSIVKGVQDLENQTGKPSMPEHREATVEVVETVKRWEDFENKIITLNLAFDPRYGLHCPICDYRSFSNRPKNTMKRHFAQKHADYTLLFDES